MIGVRKKSVAAYRNIQRGAGKSNDNVLHLNRYFSGHYYSVFHFICFLLEFRFFPQNGLFFEERKDSCYLLLVTCYLLLVTRYALRFLKHDSAASIQSGGD